MHLLLMGIGIIDTVNIECVYSEMIRALLSFVQKVNKTVRFLVYSSFADTNYGVVYSNWYIRLNQIKLTIWPPKYT